MFSGEMVKAMASLAQQTEPRTQAAPEPQSPLTPPSPAQRIGVVLGQVILENANLGYEVECLRIGFAIEKGRADGLEPRVAEAEARAKIAEDKEQMLKEKLDRLTRPFSVPSPEASPAGADVALTHMG